MKRLIVLSAVILFVLSAVTGVVGCQEEPTPTPNQEPKVVSKEDSQEIAVDFLRSSPTFRFDGLDDTLELIRSEGDERTSRWEFHYKFQSAAAGYGDRSGMMLAQVITDHEVRSTVERGEVVHAVLDGRWDMIKQKMLK